MIAASSLISRLAFLLQDFTGVRWTAAELVGWINEGALDLCVKRPDANTVLTQNMPLVAGYVQSLPSGTLTLIDIQNNSASGRPIRDVDLDDMDMIIPRWRTGRPAQDIEHFMYSMLNPRTFYVYPPALSTSAVDMVLGNTPTALATPTGDYTTITGNVTVAGIWDKALVDYVMFRALSKDAEFADNANAATAYYASYKGQIGDQTTTMQVVTPNPKNT